MKNIYPIAQVCLLIFAAFVTSCSAQDNSKAKYRNTESITNAKVEKINELVQQYTENQGFNGSILVTHEGEIIYKKGFGLANMEWDIPNNVDTKFRIASITKPFTATLVLQLVAEGKLDLNESVSTYLPDYPKESGEKITLHQLLTHTSGLQRDVDAPEKIYHSPKDLVKLFADKPLVFNPGEQFQYSNAGYILLGYIVETISEKKYKQVLQDKIFGPLGMKNSGYYRHRLLLKNRSSGYQKGFGEYLNANYMDFSKPFSSGAIYSTVEDMFLFDQALYSEKLLPKKYLALVLTKHTTADFGGHYGYGWEIGEKPMGNTNEMVKTIGHSGSLPGYCSIYTSIPSSNSTIILLNNTGRAYLNAITTAVTGILYDKTYDFPKKSVASLLWNKIEQEGMEQGIQFFNKVKDNDAYYLSENELNVVSYKLLRSNQKEGAADVLRLALGVYPEAFNLYDSYGEVLLTLGKKEEAIKNYQKSIELNPDNKNGIKVLKKLGVTLE